MSHHAGGRVGGLQGSLCAALFAELEEREDVPRPSEGTRGRSAANGVVGANPAKAGAHLGGPDTAPSFASWLAGAPAPAGQDERPSDPAGAESTDEQPRASDVAVPSRPTPGALESALTALAVILPALAPHVPAAAPPPGGKFTTGAPPQAPGSPESLTVISPPGTPESLPGKASGSPESLTVNSPPGTPESLTVKAPETGSAEPGRALMAPTEGKVAARAEAEGSSVTAPTLAPASVPAAERKTDAPAVVSTRLDGSATAAPPLDAGKARGEHASGHGKAPAEPSTPPALAHAAGPQMRGDAAFGAPNQEANLGSRDRDAGRPPAGGPSPAVHVPHLPFPSLAAEPPTTPATAPPASAYTAWSASLADGLPGVRVDVLSPATGTARIAVEGGPTGELSLELRVQDGVTHVRAEGAAMAWLQSGREELAHALAREGLTLGGLELAGSGMGFSPSPQHRQNDSRGEGGAFETGPAAAVGSGTSAADPGRAATNTTSSTDPTPIHHRRIHVRA